MQVCVPECLQLPHKLGGVYLLPSLASYELGCDSSLPQMSSSFCLSCKNASKSGVLFVYLSGIKLRTNGRGGAGQGGVRALVFASVSAHHLALRCCAARFHCFAVLG